MVRGLRYSCDFAVAYLGPLDMSLSPEPRNKIRSIETIRTDCDGVASVVTQIFAATCLPGNAWRIAG